MGTAMIHKTSNIKYQAMHMQSNSHDHYYRLLLDKLAISGSSIKDLIKIKKLYLRISITGKCNYSCKFCHNEGGPLDGTLFPRDSMNIVKLANDLGFDRVQFTGGEPLLNKKLERHIELSRKYINDIGITTNGSLLTNRISALISAGLSRMHLSLQRESLTSDHSTEWTMPDWLITVLEKCSKADVAVRLNIPVEPSELNSAKEFIAKTEQLNCNLLLFSLLPNTYLQRRQQYINELKSISLSENERRGSQAVSRIYAREYFKPSGVRCYSCDAKELCAESSRSLRVGVDKVLRPCLASRCWDVPLNRLDNKENLLKATLFALDFSPF